MPPKTRPVYIIKIFGHISIFGKSGGATWSQKVPIIEAGFTFVHWQKFTNPD